MAGIIARKVFKVDKETQTDEGLPDEDGFHCLWRHDDTRLRFRLLLGGPGGNHRIDPEKLTVICLHGLGERLESWEELVFRQQELPASFSSHTRSLTDKAFSARQGKDCSPLELKAKCEDTKRRAKIVQGLASRLNVVLLDLRGFGGSSRPTSSRPIEDTSLIALYTFTIVGGGMQAFTEAAQADIQASRRAGNECHTISVSGSTALVRIVHRDAERYCASRKWLCLQNSRVGPVRLYRLDLCGTREVLDSVEADEATHLTAHSHSYKVDKASRRSEDILVVHVLELPDELDDEGSAALDVALHKCSEEMRQESVCLSFHASRSGSMAVLQATFATSKGAIACIKRVRAWLVPASEEARLGTWATLRWTQLHARGAVVKKLRARQEVEELDVQLFQFFPLSFDAPLATEAPACMNDFIEDVESVRQYLGAPQVALLGHSFGAAVAIRYAVEHPAHVTRLAALGGWGRISDDIRSLWANIAGHYAGWTESVIRGAILGDDVLEDDRLHGTRVPMLLVSAKDDFVVPARSAQELRAALPDALLETPSWGGHNAAASNGGVLERVVQFLLADEAMVFADDPLCAEMLGGAWNLASDKAFARYYELGRALAEVESAHRRVRLTLNWALDGDHQDLLKVGRKRFDEHDEHLSEFDKRRQERINMVQREEEAKLRALRKVGLEEFWSDEIAPRDVLLHMMDQMLEEMCAPARLAAEQAGLWWRDPGKGEEGYSEGKYTVDAFGKRRGGSKKTHCAWFRWDLTCVPPQLREGYAMEEPDSEMFRCWWCGGLPSDHTSLGRMAEGEEPGYYPGIAAGRREWQPPPRYGAKTVPAAVLDESEAALSEPWDDERSLPYRRICVN